MSPRSKSFDYEPITRRSAPKTAASEEFPASPFATPFEASKAEFGRNASTSSNTTARNTNAQQSSIPGTENHSVKLDQQFRKWVLKRGHTLSYAGLFLFTLVLYFRPYELSDSLAFLDKVAFAVAIATFLIFVPSQITLEGNLTVRPREINLVILLAIAGLLSIGPAISSSEAWTEFNDVFIKAVLMFIVMVNVVRTRQRLRLLMYIALGVTVLLSYGALRDYNTGNFTVEGYRIRGLLGGMFGNPNDLALHFVTMTPLAIGLMMASRRVLGKVIFGTTAILIIAANVVTYSRGGFLGLVATAAVLTWKLGRQRRFLFLVFGSAFLAVFVSVAPGNYGVRLLSIFVPSLDTFGSGNARQAILDRSILVSIRNPILGIGMGNFHTVSLHETVTHNAFTQVSAEMGFAAFIIYLMFLTAPFSGLRRIEGEAVNTKQTKRTYYYLAVALQASLSGYMVSAFFAAVAYQWYAYYLIAYAVCLRRIYQADEQAQVEATAALVEAKKVTKEMTTGHAAAI